MQNMHTPRRSAPIIMVLFFVAAAFGVVGLQVTAGPGDNGEAPAGQTVSEEVKLNWDEVQRLQNEQKYEAAFDLVEAIRVRAAANDDAAEWTRAIVEQVKLRSALHGYETAVRFLKDEPWPDDEVSRAVLDLYYAHSLVTYVHAYSWEIRQRERVETTAELDLKKWDVDQIVEESNRAFGELWARRGSWGDEGIGALARYIDQNDFPPRIRGTLRDAVSYLWTELLADTSLWRPDQSNDVFRIDFAALLAGSPAESAVLDLADPELHPLVKIGAVLDDLEAWHASSARPEAALEARLERLRRFNAAFSNRHDRLAIRESLETTQAGFDPSYEWWSMGQSLLAELIRAEDAPDALIRARAAAVAGRDRHPKSIGGERCNHTVAAIEAPSYAIQVMTADGEGRRSIQIDSANLDTLYFRAYPYDLIDAITSAEDHQLLPGHREVPEIMAASEPVAEWTHILPPSPDYRSHLSYSVPPISSPGAYLIVASPRRDFSENQNLILACNFLLTDLVLVTEQADGGYEITARSGSSGQALGGVTVELFRFDWRNGHRAVATRTTGPDGRVKLSPGGWRRERHFLLARDGENLAYDLRGLWQYSESERSAHTAALVYTDRSVYRPQQELHFKVVAYRGGGEDIEYRTLPGTAISVSLMDANYEIVAETTLETNAFGSASASFEIPAGRLLGQWRLRDLPRRRHGGAGRGVQAADLRGHHRRPPRGPSPQPAGGSGRQRPVLLRPPGGHRRCPLAGDPGAGLPLVVGLVVSIAAEREPDRRLG